MVWGGCYGLGKDIGRRFRKASSKNHNDQFPAGDRICVLNIVFSDGHSFSSSHITRNKGKDIN